MTLYEITNDYIEKMEFLLNDGIDANTGEILENLNEEQLAKIQEEISKDLIEKSKNIYAVNVKYENEIETLEKEIKRLKELKDKKSKKLNNFKEYVLNAMQKIDRAKLNTEIGSIILRKTKRVQVADETKLDKKYFKEKISIELDKNKIKEDIKNGFEVKGAYLEDNYTINFK